MIQSPTINKVKNKIINTSATICSCDLFKFELNGLDTRNKRQNKTIIKKSIITIIGYKTLGFLISGKTLLESFN
jgi:hypothetical protein